MSMIETNNLPAEFKDPFKPDKVKMIAIYYMSSRTKFTWSGKVEFENDNTGGEQKFNNCKTLEEVAYKIKNFIGSLQDE